MSVYGGLVPLGFTHSKKRMAVYLILTIVPYFFPKRNPYFVIDKTAGACYAGNEK